MTAAVKELTILSGKGGTGKTTLAGAFAVLAERKVIADLDVDAPDLHIILQPKILQEKEFYGMEKARIELDECISCGLCLETCRFDAISPNYVVDENFCEGCRACTFVCPTNAIKMVKHVAGRWFISETRYGPMVHGQLGVAEENSGKLVTVIRTQAKFTAQKEGYPLILLDGPPGIGCPVISSLTGVKYALVVAEPTQSGMHDLGRLFDLFEHFDVQAYLVVNKYDLNPEVTAEIERFAYDRGVRPVGRIPFDEAVVEALVNAKPVIEYCDCPAGEAIKKIWERMVEEMEL
ncbi:MAG: (4Fe-4S)-binding protein [Candidatus Hydrothermota bacterium]|nr:MAG: (4Fe-4S)-binding protein [Candidatus Hydrothermae bacterium]